MSASFQVHEHESPRPVVVPAFEARSWRDHGSPLLRQLAVVREMLPTLDTVSAAGQQHLMGKVVAFIQEHSTSAYRSLSRRNQEMFAELLDRLRRESNRIAPDVQAFCHGAESLLVFLGAIV
jgi:hypothetical protein